MKYKETHRENHLIGRFRWVRAAVMGANDGVVSTASLLVGVSSTRMSLDDVIISGVAGMVAGATSMAVGEYISVSAQVDIAQADLRREAEELLDNFEHELDELTDIYISRGVDMTLAREVSRQLMSNNALSAHARDELGLTDNIIAKPALAAMASALSFLLGGVILILMVLISPREILVRIIFFTSTVCFSLIGVLGGIACGANILYSMVRIMFWGTFAMIITYQISNYFGKIY